MGVQIDLVKADNWEGLYVNEKLVCEDHQIEITEIMTHVLHNHVDSFEVYAGCNEALAENGSFPKSLREVELEDGRTIAEYWET